MHHHVIIDQNQICKRLVNKHFNYLDWLPFKLSSLAWASLIEVSSYYYALGEWVNESTFIGSSSTMVKSRILTQVPGF
jgi:hypothetical protein